MIPSGTISYPHFTYLLLSLRRYLRLFVAIETCEDTNGVITRPVLRYHKGDYETGAKIPQG
jgi:hypothetical protein